MHTPATNTGAFQRRFLPLLLPLRGATDQLTSRIAQEECIGSSTGAPALRIGYRVCETRVRVCSKSAESDARELSTSDPHPFCAECRN